MVAASPYPSASIAVAAVLRFWPVNELFLCPWNESPWVSGGRSGPFQRFRSVPARCLSVSAGQIHLLATPANNAEKQENLTELKLVKPWRRFYFSVISLYLLQGARVLLLWSCAFSLIYCWTWYNKHQRSYISYITAAVSYFLCCLHRVIFVPILSGEDRKGRKMFADFKVWWQFWNAEFVVFLFQSVRREKCQESRPDCVLMTALRTSQGLTPVLSQPSLIIR